MPGDHDRILDVLRLLRNANDHGRIETDAAVECADATDRVRGRRLLDDMEDKGWVRFRGLHTQLVEITGAGRDELTYQDDWEATTPTPGPALTGRAAMLAGDPDLLADVVLQEIYQAAGASADRMVVCPSPEPGLSPHSVMAVLWQRLVPAGRVQLGRVPLPPVLPEVALTPAGCAYVDEARSIMADSATRCAQVRGALLRSLHDAPGGVLKFSDGNRGAFRGQFFTLDDVTKATRYLKARRLVVRTGRGVRINQAGLDWVQRGADPAELTGSADQEDDVDKVPQGAVVTFFGILAPIGWAAVPAFATFSKLPMMHLWLILSLVVAVLATVLFLLTGGVDVIRWLRRRMRRMRRVVRSRRLTPRLWAEQGLLGDGRD
jgi:hypothetical protein